MARAARIRRELELLTSAGGVVGVSAGPVDPAQVGGAWAGTLAGPPGSPYEGGVFHLDIRFPDAYPYRPPAVRFCTPILHPNVNTAGQICLDILKDEWSPVLTIGKTLLSLLSLLTDPNPDDPLDRDAAELYVADRPRFDARARQMTRLHATDNAAARDT